MKFGHAITETEVKSVQISPPRANDPSHPCTCRYKLIAAAFTVNTAHFTFGDQTHTYILSCPSVMLVDDVMWMYTVLSVH